jgi:hypothetical protein
MTVTIIFLKELKRESFSTPGSYIGQNTGFIDGMTISIFFPHACLLSMLSERSEQVTMQLVAIIIAVFVCLKE